MSLQRNVLLGIPEHTTQTHHQDETVMEPPSERGWQIGSEKAHKIQGSRLKVEVVFLGAPLALVDQASAMDSVGGATLACRPCRR